MAGLVQESEHANVHTHPHPHSHHVKFSLQGK
jgi:hypothetical protein